MPLSAGFQKGICTLLLEKDILLLYRKLSQYNINAVNTISINIHVGVVAYKRTRFDLLTADGLRSDVMLISLLSNGCYYHLSVRE